MKTITIEQWDAATTEQRSEWLRDGVLVDSPALAILRKRLASTKRLREGYINACEAEECHRVGI